MSLPKPTTDRAQMSADLVEHGYCLVADALGAEQLNALSDAVDRVAREDTAAGQRFLDTNGNNQRLWQLLNRGPEFLELAEHPLALDLAGEVLGNRASFGSAADDLPQFLLSSLTGNIAGPAGHPMTLHADQGYVHEPWPDYPLVCNGGWLIDDFTPTNGATLVVPGSHLLNRHPDRGAERDAVPVIGPAGTLLFLDGRTWHGTGANTTDGDIRRALFSYFCQQWIRLQENHSASLKPEVVASMSPTLRRLCGFDMFGRSLGMIDGLPTNDLAPSPTIRGYSEDG